jgi:hypothetical protein
VLPVIELPPVRADSNVVVVLARYTLDPMAEPAPKRRFARRRDEEPDGVEVPARPTGPRHLPGQLTGS